MIRLIFPYKLLLTDTQVSRILKAFANSLLADAKFLKTQLSKMVQFQGLIESILVPYSLLFNSE